MAMMAELSHLEEIIGQLDKHTADPFSLPSSTEQVKQLFLLVFGLIDFEIYCVYLLLLLFSDDCGIERQLGSTSLGFANATEFAEFAGIAQVFHVQFGFNPQLIQRKRRQSFPGWTFHSNRLIF